MKELGLYRMKSGDVRKAVAAENLLDVYNKQFCVIK